MIDEATITAGIVCACCGKEIESGTVTADGEIVCDDCREEHYTKCSDCGEWRKNEDFSDGEKDADGEPICDSCWDDNWTYCDDCGEPVRIESTYRVRGDKHVCESCLEEDYVMCIDCEEYVPRDDARITTEDTYVCDDCYDNGSWTTCEDCDRAFNMDDEGHCTHNGLDICDACFDDNYFTCEDCGEIFHVDDEVEIDGCYYCSSCAESHSEEVDASEVLDYHAGRKRGMYAPRRLEGEGGDTLLFGVELEVDGLRGAFDADDFSEWTEDDNLVHFEHDGSLNYGVECITQPCSLGMHQTGMKWDALCRKFIGEGFRSHDTTTCGLHVHIGRSQLSVLDVVKLDVWINRWMLWTDIARRESIYSGSYDRGKRVDVRHAVNNISGVHSTLEKYLYGDCSGRYVPVNTSNRDTVEVRIFKGTLNHETILGTLEGLHALCKFAKTVPIKQVYDRDLPEKFLRYVADNKEKYIDFFPMARRLVKARHNSEVVMGIIAKNNPSQDTSDEDTEAAVA